MAVTGFKVHSAMVASHHRWPIRCAWRRSFLMAVILLVTFALINHATNDGSLQIHSQQGVQPYGSIGFFSRVSSAPSWLVRKLMSSSTALAVITYDLNQEVNSTGHQNWTCLRTSTHPSYPVCVYDPAEDRFVSAQLLSQGVWEPEMTRLFQAALRNYPESGVLDLGANIGTYTLLAATMGHRVCAVEPVWDNVLHLQKAARMTNVTTAGLVTVVPLAVSDVHELVAFRYQKGNMGGTSVRSVAAADIPAILKRDKYGVVGTVTLDDLSAIVNASTVILKMDIEGYECKAVRSSTSFFDSHFVPYIFMEWENMFRNRHRYSAPCKPRALRGIADALVARGFRPLGFRSGRYPLDPQSSASEWRIGDVVWQHERAPELPIDSDRRAIYPIPPYAHSLVAMKSNTACSNFHHSMQVALTSQLHRLHRRVIEH